MGVKFQGSFTSKVINFIADVLNGASLVKVESNGHISLKVINTQQNWCASDKFIIYWHIDGVTFPKGEVNLVFVRGRGVKGIRLDKINSAAPHNHSGLSHEVKGYHCLSKGFGRFSGQGS